MKLQFLMRRVPPIIPYDWGNELNFYVYVGNDALYKAYMQSFVDKETIYASRGKTDTSDKDWVLYEPRKL